ncbi:MAG: hypothetical protein LUC97_12330 [Clostridiales bacterium]|nr:hypothetical protein [Clostridiales bacterium]
MTANTDKLTPESAAYIKALQEEISDLKRKNKEAEKEKVLLSGKISKLEKENVINYKAQQTFYRESRRSIPINGQG